MHYGLEERQIVVSISKKFRHALYHKDTLFYSQSKHEHSIYVLHASAPPTVQPNSTEHPFKNE